MPDGPYQGALIRPEDFAIMLEHYYRAKGWEGATGNPAGRLAGQIGMFNEFFTIDPAKSMVLMGHPGHGEIRFADESTVMVTQDLEVEATQKRGAWLSYRARAGQMTFLNFTLEYGKLKCAAFQAEALGGPRIIEG